MNKYTPCFISVLAGLFLLSGCASSPFDGSRLVGGPSPTTRTFEVPIARVKPAFISTLAPMGMTVAALETRGKSEVIRARKAGSEVEIELEPLGRTSTRARVAAKTGSEDNATAIMRQAEKLLGGT